MASLSPDSELGRLMARFPRTGSVAWIGVRPARGKVMRAVDSAEAVTGKSLAGDRYIGASGKRGITLIQAEHLPVIAALAGHASVAPDVLRRNLVVAGIPLIALKDRRFRIGEVVVQGTGPCDPCSRMVAVMGEGGYNAMRGMGGICVRILPGGTIRCGDVVAVDA